MKKVELENRFLDLRYAIEKRQAERKERKFVKRLPKYKDPTSLHELTDSLKRTSFKHRKLAEIYSHYGLLVASRDYNISEANEIDKIIEDLVIGSGNEAYLYFKKRFDIEKKASEAVFLPKGANKNYQMGWANWYKLCANIVNTEKNLKNSPIV